MKRQMWYYVIYFIAGGALVTSVAYFAARGNPFLAALVGSIPVMFLLNIYLVYQAGGLSSSLAYSRGVLSLLPVFILFVVTTIWFLPQLGMPKALLPGMTMYLALAVISQVKKDRMLKRWSNHEQSLVIGQDITTMAKSTKIGGDNK